MQTHDSAPHPQRQLCPFPYALYDSHGTLFELMQGGQATQKPVTVTPEVRNRFSVLPGGTEARRYQVHWERLNPAPEKDQDPTDVSLTHTTSDTPNS